MNKETTTFQVDFIYTEESADDAVVEIPCTHYFDVINNEDLNKQIEDYRSQFLKGTITVTNIELIF